MSGWPLVIVMGVVLMVSGAGLLVLYFQLKARADRAERRDG